MLTPTFNTLRKNLQRDTSSWPSLRIALLADSASQLINQSLKGYGIQHEYNFDIFESDYDQIDQEILNTSSALYVFEPEVVVINLCTEKLLKAFYCSAPETRDQFAEIRFDKIFLLWDALHHNGSAKVIINTFPEINDGVFGNFAAKENSSFIYQLRKLNLKLMDLAAQNTNLFICDLLAIQAEIGYSRIFDSRMYINADMAYSLDFLPMLAKSVFDIIAAVKGIIRKAVILDLDNTIWGGVIGDDGLEGIQIGYQGLGKAFTDFQLWLKQLKQRGIILAVCSKNNEEIAKEPFIHHPDMSLRMEDISLFVANWENKVDNIRFIQSVLNIGMDSIVFLDDNPFEREMVRSAIPELIIPELPEDPSEYLIYLRSLGLFETASFIEEDKQRTTQYQEESKRTVLKKTFKNEDEFLESLEMTAVLEPFDNFTLPRVAQLTQRSNQFNLRTKRYTESDIQSMMNKGDHFTMAITLADKFGNYGLISAIILSAIGETEIFVDTWIMSCRVLKRGVESLALNAIVDMAQKHGYRKIIGEYIPTKKNGLVKDHYRNLHFKERGNLWILDTANYDKMKVYIKHKDGEIY